MIKQLGLSLVVLALFMLFAVQGSSALAESPPWLEQENPNELGLYIDVGDKCPMTTEELAGRIEGEYLRARIKPNSSLSLNLTVSVSCLQAESEGNVHTGYAVYAQIKFGTQMANGENVLYEYPDFGTLLVGGTDASNKRFFIEAIGDRVATALTDYLKANLE